MQLCNEVSASIEQHVEWIAECVAYVRREGAAEIDAVADAEEAWVAHARMFPVASFEQLSSLTMELRETWIGGRGRCCDSLATDRNSS